MPAMASKITLDVLKGYLNCKFKTHLLLAERQGIKSDYEVMLSESRRELRLKAIEKINSQYPERAIVKGIVLTRPVLSEGAPLILDADLRDKHFSIHFDGLRKVEGHSVLGDFHYLPVLYCETRRIDRVHRILLEVLALFLSRIQAKTVSRGIIYYGGNCNTAIVRFTDRLQAAENLLANVVQMQVGELPPPLLLNKHCHVCEFRQECHANAIKEDNLSLLRALGEKEIRSYGRKGVFTLTQLARTFRPRRKGKQSDRGGKRRYHALQAMAIRDKTIYVLGEPKVPSGTVRIYLDLEGVPEDDFVYLIGMIVCDGDSENQYSFWADSKDQEKSIFDQLLDVLSKYDAPAIFCYGNYETAFVKRMRKHAQRKKPVDELLDAMINILSTIYSHFYFPTYSNGLKEVGSVLGCSWGSADASGIQSITWRIRWDRTHNDCWKTKLIEYNLQDCSALRRVTDFLLSACTWTPALPNPSCHNAVSPMVAQVQELDGFAYSQKWGRPTFVHPDFEFVNKCAYFDYQRQRVFIRTSRTLKKNRRTPGHRRNAELRVSRRIDITASKCPNCGDTKLKELPRGERIKGTYTVAKRAFDVVTTPTGMRRQVIECTATGYRCTQCGNRFISQRYHRLAKYFHGLMSWATYQHVAHRLSTRSLQELCREFFGLVVGKSDIHMFQSVMARYYRSTYQKLLAKMISGPLLHIDETEVKLRTGKGYVWVFTSLEEVVYMYRPTREGKFLPEMLKNFEGVLVSDFYVAYDALICPQQKCLIHLIRDMNQELLNNPYDMEFQTITLPFGSLLRSIVATADEHGLKGRHLKRHGSEVTQFFEVLSAQSCRSDAAQALQKRLIKYRSKLFSFIEHDGVPWNNNNAENAIKGFARYRDGTVGVLSEGGLTDYLVLLSIYQTCRYKGLSFLKFLLSHVKDVDKFCAGKLVRYPLHEVELYPKGYTPPHLVRLRRLNVARPPAATENSPI